MPKRVRHNGQVYNFPDDATEAEIISALQSMDDGEAAPPSRPSVSTGEDIARSAVTGVQRGTAFLAGLPGDIARAYTDGTDYLARGVQRLGGASDEQIAANQQAADALRRRISPNDGGIFATGEELNDTTQRLFGEQWEPQTDAGEYARTIGEFAPNAVFPGGPATRIARAVIPGAATEFAGDQAARINPDYEMPARFAGALTSALGVESAVGALSRLSRRPAPVVLSDEEIAARELEDEWLPMTRGERTRNPRAIQRETELRRGGPAQAQQTLRDFDNDRASAFSDRLVRVATRGRNPNTESLSDAGTVVADDLRSGYEAMQTQQSARYAEAMRLAEAQRVAPTDELAANVNRVVEENFLDVGPAVGVINRLQAQINAGSANYGSIERARQQLNRLLGASMRAGDDAQTYAIHRVIDELDAFAEPRLTGEAQTAIREARRYTREMMGTYGEQARPDLATGHVGRGDRGGRRIRDIIENDMTGEQVIDAIFGAGGRPPAPALAAVRRIHDRATRTISTGGYEAPSGAPGQQQRAPGRESLRGGRSTTGGRQFLEPTEAQRAQLGLGAGEREAIADPSLQALREAFIYRLSRRLTNRQQGDGIPARLMASDLRAALDGTGSEITPLLFNAEERSMLRRAMLAMEQVSPPSGQYNPSAPGIAQDAAERSFAAIAARILGEVPYVGPSIGAAIQDGIVNARAIRDAREAVARSAAAPVAPTWRSDLFQSRPQPAAPASSAAQSDVDRRARR